MWRFLVAYAGQPKKFRCEVHIFAKISESFFHLLVSECLGINSSNSDLFANNLQEMDLRDLNFTSILLAHLKRITQLKKKFKKAFSGSIFSWKKRNGTLKTVWPSYSCAPRNVDWAQRKYKPLWRGSVSNLNATCKDCMEERSVPQRRAHKLSTPLSHFGFKKKTNVFCGYQETLSWRSWVITAC